MSGITGEPPVMWGSAIVGFGRYHHRYDSGREGDWFLMGFSPRTAAITVYSMGGVWNEPGRLEALGKCTGESSCLYVKSLADINLQALRAALTEGARRIHARRTEVAASRASKAKPAGSRVVKKTVKKAAKKTPKLPARNAARTTARKSAGKAPGKSASKAPAKSVRKR
jgi:hypothetical protein